MNKIINLGNVCDIILESLKEGDDEGTSQEELIEDIEISDEISAQILDFMIEFDLIQIDPGKGKIRLQNFGSKICDLPDE